MYLETNNEIHDIIAISSDSDVLLLERQERTAIHASRRRTTMQLCRVQ